MNNFTAIFLFLLVSTVFAGTVVVVSDQNIKETSSTILIEAHRSKIIELFNSEQAVFYNKHGTLQPLLKQDGWQVDPLGKSFYKNGLVIDIDKTRK